MADKPLRTPALLSVVAPVYDEEELVEEFVDRALAAVADYEFELVLVNDGSSDRTPELLDRIAARDRRVRVIHLSRNFGHQAALTAGLEHAVGDVVAMIDADLQDPPELIPELVDSWRNGADVVYGLRTKGHGSVARRVGTSVFYWLLKASRTSIPQNVGTFGVMDRRVVDVLNAMPERSRFFAGF